VEDVVTTLLLSEVADDEGVVRTPLLLDETDGVERTPLLLAELDGVVMTPLLDWLEDGVVRIPLLLDDADEDWVVTVPDEEPLALPDELL
jgi:hypothetical protein